MTAPASIPAIIADELELIASLIRRAPDGAHGTGAKP